ncbi:uncharacterized protein P174DRAFT_9718 [Aspergillus novofumigatus IBT 16806]|uniref:Uncharacterized protein n=1 Tax=Aspergillus novofumigatus (strain IBT 16806) TaxID=1392255 RepID=A0A2I1CKW6_ASPN1|nr:uncharacterized protein P174DRAFT_9718 [Aspergillus novofumigatus IBT 16806]PKX98246.1 hypothetical protein P174DRAFT_9718 [Aspergillus novofumigatus IBT 16806]
MINLCQSVALVCNLQECLSCSSGRVLKPNGPVEYVPRPPRIRLSAPGRMRYPPSVKVACDLLKVRLWIDGFMDIG